MTRALRISGDEVADRLLSEHGFALLIGMLLDQQVPMEAAFAGPAKLRDRLGGLDASAIARMDPEEFQSAFAEKPAVHRFPGSMAKRVQQLAAVVAEEWGGDAGAIWRQEDPDGPEVLRRLQALPGFGEHKAHLPRAARQAGRLRRRRMGGCVGTVRRAGREALGGRHHRCRIPRRGAGDEAGGEAGREGRRLIERRRQGLEGTTMRAVIQDRYGSPDEL